MNDSAGNRPRTKGRPRNNTGKYSCGRCGLKFNHGIANFPEGRLCLTCYRKATDTYGRCPHCGQHRMLPGVSPATDNPICAECAGITRNLHCKTCGKERRPYRGGSCATCALRADLYEMMGKQADVDKFAILTEALCAADRPESVLTWKLNPKVSQFLKFLGAGNFEWARTTFDEYIRENPKSKREVEHVRAILIKNEALRARDYDLHAFGQWWKNKLQTVDSPSFRKVLNQFISWDVTPRINESIKDGRNTRRATHAAKQHVSTTIDFLNWLHSQGFEDLSRARQPDVDFWLTSGPSTRRNLRPFLSWTSRNGYTRKLKVPVFEASNHKLISKDERSYWIMTFIEDDSIHLHVRVAGLLLLVFAQPLANIVELEINDVTDLDGKLFLKLGSQAVPIPSPIVGLFRDYLDHRPNLRGANAGSSWLFPGVKAGRFITVDSIKEQFRKIGFTQFLGARSSSFEELLAIAPAPLVADALGYSYKSADKHSLVTNQSWAHYVGVRTKRETEQKEP